ncbi:MAG: hypothetical protein ACM3IJ_01800 [Candidatus Levyibacteriota bacterium]
MSGDLKVYIEKYRYVALPIGFIVIGVLIFFQLIVPSFGSIGELNQKVASESKKLQDYKDSAAVLSRLDDSQLSQQETLAAKALPSSKDIQAIYLAITTSAANANIFVRGFSVKVGDIFQKTASKANSVNGVPFITVTVQVSQVSASSLYAFSTQLGKQLPLNNRIRATVSAGEGNMDIAFYYKPYDLDALNSNIVNPLSKQEVAVLQNLLDRQSTGQ